MILFGAGTATGLQSRYAAAEFSQPERQARAMSIVLWATTVGSVLGPNLSAPGAHLGSSLGLVPYSGPYLFSLVGFLSAGAVVLRLRERSHSRRHSEIGAAPTENTRPLSSRSALLIALRQRRSAFALAAVVLGQMMMTSVMIMTPVSMNHHGMGLELVGIVISIHIVGMYALSPVFGWLSDKIGPARVIWIAVALFLCAFLMGIWDAANGPSVLPRLVCALALLGLGWSACLIGGSTLLVRSVSPEVKVPLQGASDALMSFGAALLGALSGPVLAAGGFLALNLMACLVLLALVLMGLRTRAMNDAMPGAMV